MPFFALAERLPTFATLHWKIYFQNSQESNVLTKLVLGGENKLNTLVLPERRAKLNETVIFKEHLFSAWKDHPPELYLRKLEEAKNTLRQNMFLQNWGQMIINNGALLG